jgi:hypothetical protein
MKRTSEGPRQMVVHPDKLQPAFVMTDRRAILRFSN